MSQEAIIKSIRDDADSRASAMIQEASAKADEIVSAAAEACKSYCEQSRYDIDKAVKDIAERSKVVSELDARKTMLNAKFEVINKIYALALEKARNLNKDVYKQLLLGMLTYAEDGDVVTISKREVGILTAEDVKEFGLKHNIRLSLSDKLGDFDGGMIISGGGVDKNVTLEVEIEMLREETETMLAKELAD